MLELDNDWSWQLVYYRTLVIDLCIIAWTNQSDHCELINDYLLHTW